MTVVNHRTLTDTPECVQQLCDDANEQSGCHLRYVSTHNGKHTIEDRTGTAALHGTAVELVHLIGAYQGGFMAGQREGSAR